MLPSVEREVRAAAPNRGLLQDVVGALYAVDLRVDATHVIHRADASYGQSLSLRGGEEGAQCFQGQGEQVLQAGVTTRCCIP